MTSCKYCGKMVKELGKDICSQCYDKKKITKGWKFIFRPKKKPRKD